MEWSGELEKRPIANDFKTAQTDIAKMSVAGLSSFGMRIMLELQRVSQESWICKCTSIEILSYFLYYSRDFGQMNGEIETMASRGEFDRFPYWVEK
jgi:hypothetical protein